MGNNCITSLCCKSSRDIKYPRRDGESAIQPKKEYMPAIKSITLKCGHCGASNPSAIFFASTEALESSTTYGNTQTCNSCGKTIKCNKENYSYVLADGSGGMVANDFINNKPS